MTLSIWLVGAGSMAQEYARILIALKQTFEVIGRGENSASLFKKVTGCYVKTSGLKYILKKNIPPKIAIIAVGVEQLSEVTRDLINAGTKKILLEKPGALNFREAQSLNLLAKTKKAEVFIAYNRRFYHSIQQLKKCIVEDGGILSASFEFTEWGHIIKSLKKKQSVKNHWLIANSSHVIDLFIHLCGKPKKWKCWNAGRLDWHPSAARFCGSGITDQQIMFSYLCDWEAPGRWGLEIMTSKRRFILRPMEKLQVIKKKSKVIETIKPENQIDKKFKPGLFVQTKKFLDGNTSLFCSLSEQVKNIKIYKKMAGY